MNTASQYPQPVAHAGFRDDVARTCGFRFELASQVANVHAQQMQLICIALTPHLMQQLTVGQYLPRMMDQQAQQVILRGRQLHFYPLHTHVAT